MATYKLESIQWRRPGVQDLEVSALVPQGQGASVPSPGDYFGGFAGQLIETRVERQGIADKITWKWRRGQLLPEQGEQGDFWSMEVGLMQIPITTHPNLQGILAAGGGVLKNNEVEWPRYLNGKKNTWYGTTSFLFPSITVTKERIRTGLSGGAGLSFPEIDEVGYSGPVDSGGFGGSSGSLPGREQWLLESHTLSKVGNELRARKAWRHGGTLGWVDQLYKKGWRD